MSSSLFLELCTPNAAARILCITSNKVSSLRAVLGNEQARDLLADLATKSDAYPVHVSRLLEIDPQTVSGRRALKQINRSAHSLLVGE